MTPASAAKAHQIMSLDLRCASAIAWLGTMFDTGAARLNRCVRPGGGGSKLLGLRRREGGVP